MKSHAPVTQQEYLLDVDTTLMSTTDTQSNITYANSSFIRVSGYSDTELIAQPHNLVRHPDMPAEAFADMWYTLQQGDSWTGLVKNRRKNGDHYWVRANVTPVYHDDKLSGYISVRNTPSAGEIKFSAPLYAAVKSKQAGKRRFYKGLVVRSGFFSPLSLLQRLSVRWRMCCPLFLLALVPVLLAAGNVNPGVIALIMALLLLLCDAFLHQQVSRPLNIMQQQAQKVVSGRKTAHIHFNRVDEIGLLMRSINQFSLNLNSLVDDVGTQVQGMMDVSQQLAENNVALNIRTEETSANLQQTATAIEEITVAVQQSLETAVQVTVLAETASQTARKGGDMMAETIGMMESISTASHKIVDIISVIDSIAFQTNILALNAAVEAARAGVMGRGFAVVAAEVRQLAQHSASAASEIKALIDDNVRSVQSGERMVENAGRHIATIVNEVMQVSCMIRETSLAAQEQTSALSLINQSITEIETMTQSNTEMVQQSVETAENLNLQAIRLTNAIHVYGG